MARTLEQIDIALAAVEADLPKQIDGLKETLNQVTLVIDQATDSLTAIVGQPANGGSPSTGLFNSFSSLNTLVGSLQTQLNVLSAQISASH